MDGERRGRGRGGPKRDELGKEGGGSADGKKGDEERLKGRVSKRTAGAPEPPANIPGLCK